jgi:hypothetical protein
MHRLLLVFSIIIAGLTDSLAQYSNIMISDQSFPNEPSIMINPKNTQMIMAGANIQSYYFSDDGGLTWETGYLNSSWGVWGDPVIVVDTSGSFYFFHLSNYDCGIWIDRIVCQKTNDNGQSWNDGTYTGLNGTKMQDKEWAVVNRKNNHIYVSWTQFDKYASTKPADSTHIMFSKSTDGAQTWTDPVRLDASGGNCLDDDSTVEGAVPAIGPNGEIYVAWAGSDGIFFDKSIDEGKTWLKDDIAVSTMPGGWAFDIPGINRCNGLPVFDCDTSGGFNRGNVYINWTDQRNGSDNTDVWLAKSTDGGQTWTAPKKVNDDATNRHQFLTWMTVDQANGNLYFVFYDRRAFSDNNTDVYLAVSKDGGETFKNIKISESPFIPDNSIFFGDYNNISAYNNVIRPIWTRLDNRQLSIWTAIIDVDALSVESEPVSDLIVENNYPNPSDDVSNISFKLRQPAVVELLVYNSFGKPVSTVVGQKYYPPGKYVESFDFSTLHLPSGIYYFDLSINGKRITKKIIYTK